VEGIVRYGEYDDAVREDDVEQDVADATTDRRNLTFSVVIS
jgi:hypothetical protein